MVYPLSLEPPVLFLTVSVIDFICNYMGGDAWTKALKWSGQQAFDKLNVTNWNVDGKLAGYVKSFKGFTFLEGCLSLLSL